MILPSIICSQVGDFQSAKIILFLKKICFSCAKLGKSLKRLRSCFELFEMFFEVKNLHFLPASSVR